MRKRRSRSPSKEPIFPLGLFVFGIVWTVFSSVFVAVPLAGPIAALPQLTWLQVPCVVDRFEIADDRKHDQPFSPEVSFRFQWATAAQAESGGVAPLREVTGTRLRIVDSREDEYATLAELRENILARPTSVCWVNSADPSQAVLQRGVRDLGGTLGMAGFGGCFVAIGIGLLMTAVQQWRTAEVEISAVPWLLYPAFGMFGLAGFGIFGGLVIPSLARWCAASTWHEMPAEVVWSEVRASGSGRSRSIHADVFYRYSYNGREYRSNTHSLFGSPSGASTARRVVAALPPGTPTSCFVNPRHPRQSIRNRAIGWRCWLFSLFSLPFMAVGFFGLRWVIRQRRGSSTHRRGKQSQTSKNT